jgi:hypothetical protein
MEAPSRPWGVGGEGDMGLASLGPHGAVPWIGCGFQKLWPWISGNSGPFPKGAPVQVRPSEMSRTIRRSAELDQASTFQDAVENGFGQIRVV